ncbi:MAG: hypothetical protein GWN01_09030, partial [Nitrosopumilaceae archaeon]|nr:hypothetical protein [Nitrosopumilaceae archaeon]NIX61652.1 hypothetical protein [Nitrosopumilaceae archaeon]
KSPRVIHTADVDVDGTVTDYISKVMDSVGKSMESTFRTVFKDGKKIHTQTVKGEKDDDTAVVID